MKANPGPPLPPQDVKGRDDLIKRLWDILDRRGVVLTAERRTGKTCIVTKMHAEAPPDKLTYYRDLEGVKTVLEFAEVVFEDVEKALSKSKLTATRARQFLSSISGAEFKGFKFPEIAATQWKELLHRIIEDLLTNQERTIVFFWDEVPWMIANINKKDGERVAMEVLDTLRELRQTHRDKLRMVYTGSIGLHHVVTALKRGGYANAPTNDMETVDVPPLATKDAEELAGLLLEGENIKTSDLQDVACAIAAATGNMAYYIQKVVDQMKYYDGAINETTPEAIVLNALTEGQDAWELSHYRTRINIYYERDSIFVLPLLDILTLADEPLSFDNLFNQLKSRMETEDVEKVREMLTLLQRDHYVQRHNDGKYSFRFPLIRRWWKIDRGIEG